MTWSRIERDDRALGGWTFERRDDEIADLRRHGRRVLRSIRAVVRDADWNTIPLVVEDVTAADRSLTLALRTSSPSLFRGSLRLDLDGDNLVATVDLEALADIDTNRTGLIVLQPPQVAGAELRVGHPDGSIEESRFPARISAHQPVIDIVALDWSDEDAAIGLIFEGDVFEMEDQRNWTDASYKTYSRPLSLPFPYRIAAGEHVIQRLRVRATTGDADAAILADPVEIVLAPAGALPSFGVAASTAPDPAPTVEHVGDALIVEADLAGVDWRAGLERAAASGRPLDVRFVLDPDAPSKLDAAVAALDRVEIVRVTAFHQVSDARHVSDHESIGLLRSALDAHGRTPQVIGGSRSHFTELNRELHRLPDDLDGLTVTVTPLFHSVDTEQIVESVAIQRLVAHETVERAAGRPVHIGPIALRPRFNDVATTPQPLSPHADLRDGYGAQFTSIDDPRQAAPELAAWTIASAAALAVPGVSSIAWFEEWGPRGIRSSEGVALPVADALRSLTALGSPDADLLSGDSPDGLIWAIGARTVDGIRVLVASIDGEPRTVDVVTPHGRATVDLAPFTFLALPFTAEPKESPA
ncbi:hypothetical protein [Microbacterium sp. NPDC089696]|uniref:hypothetical protein n=1 Tax=Microbacterium sp. NPDC089696 TaxID=3364199 RepID=UPI003811065A